MRNALLQLIICLSTDQGYLTGILKYKLQDEFEKVVQRFTDTLPVIRAAVNKNQNVSCRLSDLASDLKISIQGAHNDIYDCKMLQQVLIKLNVTSSR